MRTETSTEVAGVLLLFSALGEQKMPPLLVVFLEIVVGEGYDIEYLPNGPSMARRTFDLEASDGTSTGCCKFRLFLQIWLIPAQTNC